MLINKNIVAELQKLNTNAIGLISGADANVILAEKRKVADIDYGLTGNIIFVNDNIIDGFLKIFHFLNATCIISK